jgi:tRNA pseudouridine55 synthase
LPLTAGLDDIPVLAVDPAQAAMLRQGRLLGGRPDNHGLHIATAGSVPVALVEVSADGVRVVRGFNI